MAVYSVNKPNRTVTLHKNNCFSVPKSNECCVCMETGSMGNHFWYCEKHFHKEEIDELMNFKFWTIGLCSDCYNRKS